MTTSRIVETLADILPRRNQDPTFTWWDRTKTFIACDALLLGPAANNMMIKWAAWLPQRVLATLRWKNLYGRYLSFKYHGLARSWGLPGSRIWIADVHPWRFPASLRLPYRNCKCHTKCRPICRQWRCRSICRIERLQQNRADIAHYD